MAPRLAPRLALPALWPLLLGAAFCLPARAEVALDPAAGLEAEMGRAIFEKLWVPAPTATRASDGLGPAFNARACSNCHAQAGRGDVERFGLVAKLSAALPAEAPLPPHPELGVQLQTRAISGLAPEGALLLSKTTEGRWQPRLSPATPARIALRLAPPLYAMRQIEALPEAQIRALADPEDADGDGISGRLAMAYSPELGQIALARYGWKAEAVTLADQSAKAFNEDMGLSTPLYPNPYGDCLSAACRQAPHGEDAGLREGREVGQEALEATLTYLRALQLKPRAKGEAAARGAELFVQFGCSACHANAPLYSDLLLHDMGAGLADDHQRAQPHLSATAQASAAEWRTAPLIGLGERRTSRANGPYLHDGRAVTIAAALAWHAGEAAPAALKVDEASPAERADLLAFLESL